MGPALQVHTPPKKKQRGAPDGAPRVFRPCVAQTEEGYIRRFMQAGTAGLVQYKIAVNFSNLGNALASVSDIERVTAGCNISV